MTIGQFENLLQTLQIVELTSNVCIDGKFSGETEIRGMISSINGSCNFERQEGSSNKLCCEEMSRSALGISCYIGTETNIISQGLEIISKDCPRIQNLMIKDYKRQQRVENVRYLPTVNRFLRNLIEYEVKNAAVIVIDKENFDGMIWLERLTIQETLIETIPKNTFQGLISLKYVDLGKIFVVSHKIKALCHSNV